MSNILLIQEKIPETLEETIKLKLINTEEIIIHSCYFIEWDLWVPTEKIPELKVAYDLGLKIYVEEVDYDSSLLVFNGFKFVRLHKLITRNINNKEIELT